MSKVRIHLVLLLALALTAPRAKAQLRLPTLITTGGERDTLGMAFQLAMGELAYNVRQRTPGGPQVLFAGGDYQGAWTRDASINVWMAAAQLCPAVALPTLMEVTGPDPQAPKDTIILGQYWDKIIWALGAREYYRYSPSVAFADRAAGIIARTLVRQEKAEYDPAQALFRGPAVYGDGVAAYEDKYTQTGTYQQGGAWLSNVDKWPEANPGKRAANGWGLPMYTLSTNCVYLGAYEALAYLSGRAGRPAGEATAALQKAAELRTAIRRAFRRVTPEGQVRLRYYIDPDGASEAQEGLGLALAMRYGVATPEELMPGVYQSAYGIPCVWPSYARYLRTEGSLKHFGRHSGVVWPMVQGMFASNLWAATANTPESEARKATLFMGEFLPLTRNGLRDYEFREIYHPETGLPYGGLQEDGFEKGLIREWISTHRQTWTATAWYAMLWTGILGARYTATDELYFRPLAQTLWPRIELTNLPYGKAVLHLIQLPARKGTPAEQVAGYAYLLDGKAFSGRIAPTLSGAHTITIARIER